MRTSRETSLTSIIIKLIIVIIIFVGQIKCIIKMANCNWDPIGKAEVIYTIGTFTGAGVIIGWLDIKDN